MYNFNFVAYLGFGISPALNYVGTTLSMKMNSNDTIVCGNIVNNWHIYIRK